MIGIKDMKEMPKYCWGYDSESKKWKECPIYKGCKHHSSNSDTMPSDCPLAEIEEHKVGKWIEERDDYGDITAWHCSNCYDKTGFVTTCAWDYCPSCGTKMEGEK